VLELKAENIVIYVGDTPFEGLISTPEVTHSAPLPFANAFGIGDIVEINGEPVNGTWMLRAVTIISTPTPGPDPVTGGIAIADASRLALVDQSFEIMKAVGEQIGTILALGPGFGPQPPGAPLDQRLSNLAVVGGTGAYLGARGQLGTTGLGPDKIPIRFASARENPALRRMNGGGQLTFVIHILPEIAPEVVRFASTDLPAVFHSSDQQLVTEDDPAVPGEVLTMLVKRLGPTIPGVNPGEPFPRNPLNIANSPVDVLINGVKSTVIFAGGEPGAVDVYEVDFRVPSTASSGLADVQILAGFIRGTEFRIPID
jgi:uncharacterized protein (TIGR03437 family)